MPHLQRICGDNKRTSCCDEKEPCFRCHEASHFSTDCKNIQMCSLCFQPGHYDFECTVVCKFCRLKTRMSEECQQQKCSRCFETGHIAVNCGAEKVRIECRNCGEEGHKVSDCSSTMTDESRLPSELEDVVLGQALYAGDMAALRRFLRTSSDNESVPALHDQKLVFTSNPKIYLQGRARSRRFYTTDFPFRNHVLESFPLLPLQAAGLVGIWP